MGKGNLYLLYYRLGQPPRILGFIRGGAGGEGKERESGMQVVNGEGMVVDDYFQNLTSMEQITKLCIKIKINDWHIIQSLFYIKSNEIIWKKVFKKHSVDDRLIYLKQETIL